MLVDCLRLSPRLIEAEVGGDDGGALDGDDFGAVVRLALNVVHVALGVDLSAANQWNHESRMVREGTKGKTGNAR